MTRHRHTMKCCNDCGGHPLGTCTGCDRRANRRPSDRPGFTYGPDHRGGFRGTLRQVIGTRMVYRVEGPSDYVNGMVAQLLKQYPAEGYGTRVTYREQVGEHCTAQVERATSCD